MSEKNPLAKITVTKNGPYKVVGTLPLKRKAYKGDTHGGTIGWTPEEDISPGEDCYVLCRCGQSQNKPFCDGSHETNQFQGQETASYADYLDQIDEVTPGEGLELLGASHLCAAARFCHPHGGTWALTEQSADPEAKKEALRQACACPSGRLVMRDTQTHELIESKLDQEIVAVQDEPAEKMGPLHVTGGIPIESEETSKTYPVRNRVTLCRCGRSQNKPFCDGSHLQ